MNEPNQLHLPTTTAAAATSTSISTPQQIIDEDTVNTIINNQQSSNSLPLTSSLATTNTTPITTINSNNIDTTTITSATNAILYTDLTVEHQQLLSSIRSTMERSIQEHTQNWRSNLSNVFHEIRPLVEHAQSVNNSTIFRQWMPNNNSNNNDSSSTSSILPISTLQTPPLSQQQQQQPLQLSTPQTDMHNMNGTPIIGTVGSTQSLNIPSTSNNFRGILTTDQLAASYQQLYHQNHSNPYQNQQHQAHRQNNDSFVINLDGVGGGGGGGGGIGGGSNNGTILDSRRAQILQDLQQIPLSNSISGRNGLQRNQIQNNGQHLHHHHHHHHHHDDISGGNGATGGNGDGGGNQPNNNNINNNADGPTPAEAFAQIPEGRALYKSLLRYVPYIFILLAKAFYDYLDGILDIVALLITFSHANWVVRQEIGRQGQRSVFKLLRELIYIILVVGVIVFVLEKNNNFMSIIFANTFPEPFTLRHLLFSIGVTDLILKLITVGVKILITLMPPSILEYKNRGRIYLLAEAISQLYRGLAPIQPWLIYLLDSYSGYEKLLGVIYSAAYMVAKGSDLVRTALFVKHAFIEFLKKVSFGTKPSKEQLQTAGGQCPICHDSYTSPVLLVCSHIFCELCVGTWFDREQTCPLCRAKVVDDPSWRDGATTNFIQLF